MKFTLPVKVSVIQNHVCLYNVIELHNDEVIFWVEISFENNWYREVHTQESTCVHQNS